MDSKLTVTTLCLVNNVNYEIEAVIGHGTNTCLLIYTPSTFQVTCHYKNFHSKFQTFMQHFTKKKLDIGRFASKII